MGAAASSQPRSPVGFAAAPTDDEARRRILPNSMVEQEGGTEASGLQQPGRVHREQTRLGQMRSLGQQPHETPLRPGELIGRDPLPALVVETGEEPAELLGEPERQDHLLEMLTGIGRRAGPVRSDGRGHQRSSVACGCWEAPPMMPPTRASVQPIAVCGRPVTGSFPCETGRPRAGQALARQGARCRGMIFYARFPGTESWHGFRYEGGR